MVQQFSDLVGESSFQQVTPWLFSAYICIIAFKMIKAMYTWYHFKQLYRSGLQKPSVEFKLFTTLKAHQFGIKRKVTIWLSQSINTPVTFGFFKPVILLPVALVNNISTQQAETLILHELAHIRTNDYLLNWFLLTAETIFFFNPFVLSLCKHIRLEREKNCDLQVISFEYSLHCMPKLYCRQKG
ncbi:MAG: M56 family metallopeptidase [Chitinophagaceae bacterium]|nr:M56 family metallopeptidase [Chitinophagaceae bacterium]